MASQSFNLIGQEEEQELVAFGAKQNRVPTAQSRPNSRMEEMMSQLIKSQDATAKSLEAKVSELVKSQSEQNKSQSELIKSHTSTDDKLCRIWWIGYLPLKDCSRAALTLDRTQLGGVQPLRGMH